MRNFEGKVEKSVAIMSELTFVYVLTYCAWFSRRYVLYISGLAIYALRTVISAFWTQHVNIGLVLALLIRTEPPPSSEYECEQEHWQDAIIERIYTSSIELSNTVTSPFFWKKERFYF